jgi:hypothetical protein
MTRTVVLTSAGTGARDVVYLLPEDRELRGSSVADALVRSGTVPADALVVVSTPEGIEEARRWPVTGTGVELVALPVEDLGDPWATLQVLVDHNWRDGLPDDEELELTVDLTAGPRNVGVALLLAGQLLPRIVDRCRLGHLYLGSVLRGAARTPVHDVTGLLSAMRWSLAHEALAAGGPLGQYRDLAREAAGRARTDGVADPEFERLRNIVCNLANALAVIDVPEVVDRAGRLAGGSRASQPPTAELAVLHHTVDAALRPLRALAATDESATDQLRAQVALARMCFDWNDIPRAGIVTRELLVNRVLAADGFEPAAWLDRVRRTTAESSLHLRNDEPGRLWKRVAPQRNLIAHGGFSDQAGKVPDRPEQATHPFRKAVDRIEASLALVGTSEDPWRSPQPDVSGVRLVTPLGTSPGLLTNLLDALPTPPAELLVVTGEGCEVPDTPCIPSERRTVLELPNPFRPDEENEEIIELVRSFVRRGGEVWINLTGGTSYLGLLMHDLHNEFARSMQMVKRAILAPVASAPGDTQRYELVIVDG